MTREEMREKVKELIAQGCGCHRYCQKNPNDCGCARDADAALAIIRPETLEDAAKVADAHRLPFGDPVVPYKIGAAIRALKDKP